MTVTSVAVLVYFLRNREGEVAEVSPWRRFIAPGDRRGAARRGPDRDRPGVRDAARRQARRPGAVPVPRPVPRSRPLLGAAWAAFLRTANPTTYRGIGQGVNAALLPAQPDDAAARAPGPMTSTSTAPALRRAGAGDAPAVAAVLAAALDDTDIAHWLVPDARRAARGVPALLRPRHAVVRRARHRVPGRRRFGRGGVGAPRRQVRAGDRRLRPAAGRGVRRVRPTGSCGSTWTCSPRTRTG